MGVYYGQQIGIGFHLDEDDLAHWLDVEEIEPKKVTYEDRWDPKTGQKLEPKEIVTPARTNVTFRPTGEDVEDLYDNGGLACAVAKHLGCEVVEGFNSFGDSHFVFTVSIPTIGEEVDCGRVCFGASHKLSDVLDKLPELEKLRQKFVDEGFEPDDIVIMNVLSIG